MAGDVFRTQGATRIRSAGQGLITASVALAIGLWTLGGTVLLDMRRADRDNALQASQNVVATVASDIARNIELYDLSLRAVIDNLQNPETHRVSKTVRQLILFDRATTAKHLDALRVIDETGRVQIDSRHIDAPQRDLAQQDYFLVHRETPNAGLFIGHPYTSDSGSLSIGISRRLSHPDGSFAGAVVGTLRLDYFQEVFGRVRLGDGSAMGLSLTDGTVLMRSPYRLGYIGRNLSNTDEFQRAAAALSGHFEDAAMDGVRRLYAYQRVNDFPMLIMIGTSVDSIYASWRREARYIGAVLLVLGLATIVLAVFAAKELRKRADAEARLAVLASTDGLTGVCNRRSFDEALDREWQRAMGRGEPVGLLMIDADHFKTYNDRLGHLAGDNALAAIAKRIVSNKESSSAIVARYGGEEFAVLVPGASLHDAFRIGESIRKGVASLRVVDGDESQCPTVSIGIASRVPLAHEAPGVLVAGADLALYEAKRTGRNRTASQHAMTPDEQVPETGRTPSLAA